MKRKGKRLKAQRRKACNEKRGREKQNVPTFAGRPHIDDLPHDLSILDKLSAGPVVCPEFQSPFFDPITFTYLLQPREV